METMNYNEILKSHNDRLKDILDGVEALPQSQEKTVEITSNGATEIFPDEGYVLSKVTANVNVPTASGENKLAQLVDDTLTEITAEDLEGATKIGEYAFYRNKSVSNITLPNTVNSIEKNAFSYSAISNVTFSNTLKSIGDNAFDYCSGLTGISFPDGLESIGASAFYQAQNITGTITIPSSVRTIGKMPFAYTKIKNVIINDGLTILGASAFYECRQLETVVLPNTLEEIGDNAFMYAWAVRSLTIPSSVKKLGNKCFSGTNSANLTFLSTTPPTIGTNCFENMSYGKIIVPKGCGEAYKNATNWAEWADMIQEATE